MAIDKQSLENIQSFYKGFFDNAREACIIINPDDGSIIIANKKAFSLFKLTPDVIAKKNILDITQLNQKELILELIKVFAGKRDYFVINLDIDSPVKKVFEVYPTRIELGDNKFICLSFYDISDISNKIRFSLQYEKLLDLILEESDDIIFVCDLNGNLLYISKKAVELTGFSSKSEVLWKNLFENFFANKEDGTNIINEIRKSGFCTKTNITFLDNNQKQIKLDLRVYGSSIRDDFNAFFIAIIAKKLERFSISEQVNNAHFYKMQAVQQLAKGVAHEFNNILTGIIGFSEILKTEAEHNNRFKTYIEKILVSANRGASLVKDLNIFSQRIRPNPVIMDINEVIRQFKKTALEMPNGGIDIELIFSSEKIPVMADEDQIGIMLMHLFTNAKDAMPSGGIVTIRTEIATIDQKFIDINGFGVPGKYALIYFADQGSGISEDIKEKIFEPFFTTKEVGKGTGLGLPIVYGIVKQHHGFITVASEKGGTCFKIYLPYQPVQDELVASKDFITPPKGSEVILLAETNDILSVLIRDILEGYGYKVIITVDAEKAEEIIRNNENVRLAIVNPDMKLMNGTRLYNLIKAVRPELNVIFLNGPHHDIVSLMVLKEKEKNVIRKPFSATTLLSSVREFISSNS